ncbi:MAG: hypothetical protein FJX77_17130, partial [Armatimonadetes bacterium]|nr:hypothetical protein [Armatimonadota bacterium]
MPTPSGRIVYKLSSTVMNGTQTLAWMDGGKRVRQDTDSKLSQPPGGASGRPPMPAGGMSLKSWTIVDGGFAYMSFPMLGPEIRKMDLKKAAGRRTGPGGVPAVTIGKEQVGKSLGKGKIAGRDCTIMEMKSQTGQVAGKVWIWQNLPLKLELITPVTTMTLEATRVETPARLDAGTFKLPAGVKVVDFDPSQLRQGGGMAPGGAPRPGPGRGGMAPG